ncbi:hypothetical protein [Ancylomarina longa]|uniref:Transposase IS200-like domain-containing protein n=1 Tax=Ancylomarina longa TaxID=2487017 RepID=A0A434AZ28_9BACT|nr:hypothetical protein [Ancylomarina longa]RUT79850.1 hypothetical protein DLK05_00395 [Ancylomarina longa]
MLFEEEKTYHIYNRSNEVVFYNRSNYIYFLKKVNRLIRPYADILAWCLMPNHFHFLIVVNAKGSQRISELHRPQVQQLSKNLGSLLSSYTRAINKEQQRRGKLFAHNTKAKCLNDITQNDNILDNCFHYIHQNPVRSGLCENLLDWEFCSVLDYADKRNGKLVNKQLAYETIHIDTDNFLTQSNILLDERLLKDIF